MVRKFVCTFVICVTNILSEENDNISSVFQHVFIESDETSEYKYAILIKQAFGNQNNDFELNNLNGFVEFLNEKINLDIVKIIGQYEEENFLFVCFENNFFWKDIKIFIERIQYYYDKNSFENSFGRIYPNYYIKFNNFIFSGEKKIKYRNNKFDIDYLNICYDDNSFLGKGNIEKISVDIKEKTFSIFEISFLNEQNNLKLQTKDITSKDYSKDININKINIHQNELMVLSIANINCIIKDKIAKIKDIFITFPKYIFINKNKKMLPKNFHLKSCDAKISDNLILTLENVELYNNDDKIFFFKSIQIDMINQKINFKKGESSV